MKTCSLALLAVLIAVPSAFAQRATARQTDLQTLDLGVLAQLNAIRASHGLVPLKLNSALTTSARGHSSEMLADGLANEGLDLSGGHPVHGSRTPGLSM